MPLVKITLRNAWTANDKRILSDAIHDALVEAFHIPNHDYNHRIYELDENCFLTPHNHSAKFTIIEMTIFPGRSREAKSALYSAIISKLDNLDMQASDVMIVLNEPPLENWGIHGKRGDEIDFAFNLKI